jgi:hypothetical protein
MKAPQFLILGVVIFVAAFGAIMLWEKIMSKKYAQEQAVLPAK